MWQVVYMVDCIEYYAAAIAQTNEIFLCSVLCQRFRDMDVPKSPKCAWMHIEDGRVRMGYG